MTEIRKSHVEYELPDEEALAELSIDLDLAEARLVLATLSRVLVARRSRERRELYSALRFVKAADGTELADEDGSLRPPLLDPARLSSLAVPDTGCALRRLGVEAETLNLAWEAQPTYPGSCFPARFVCELLPAPSWALVAALVRCGPYEASLRLHLAAVEHGKTQALKTLEAQIDETWLLLRGLVAIRSETVARNGERRREGRAELELCPSLASWEQVPAKPPREQLRAIANGNRLDTTAVPPDLVRARLHELARAAEWGRWPPEEWPFNHNWLKLKRLAVLAVLAMVAPRGSHLAGMQVDDVVLDHVFRDGTRGPALLMRGERGMKSRRNGYWYAVRLPRPLADILHAWIVCNGKQPGVSKDALFPARKATHPSVPQPHAREIGTFVAPSRSHRRRQPLVPLPGNPRRGYQTHRFRSTLTQEVDRLMAQWCRQHPHDPLAGVDTSVFAECILDHTHADLGYRDLRDNDGNPTARYEQLVAAGVAAWCAELWGDGPNLRRGLDLDAIEKTHTQLRLLKARIGDLTAEVERLRREDATLDPGRLQLEDALAELLRMQQRGQRRECLLEEREELRLEQTRIERQLAEHLEREVLLAAEAFDEAYERRKTELLAAIEGDEPPPADEPQPLALADELTVADVAELFGVTPQHVRRWRRGLSTPPLDEHAWRQVNAKDFRFPVAAIDAQALRRIPAADPTAALDAIRRKRAHQGFNRARTPAVRR